MAEKNTDIVTRQHRPFGMLERFADEIDSMFEFGFGGRRPRGLTRIWAPQIDVSYQNNELVVHADLPGMKREDISVEIRENELTIAGERREEEKKEEGGGYYHSERSYGSFYRTIPLPEGAISDKAQATFKDGVLEVRLPAPPQEANRGRKLEIRGEETKK